MNNNYNNDETKVVYDNKCIITQEVKMMDVEGEILEYKHKDYITAYKQYYVGEKKRFAKYTAVDTPDFMC